MKSLKIKIENGHRDSGVYSFWPNRLAPETKELLYNGLERIVNVGDSLNEYLGLARTHETFWPWDTQDADTGLIQWDPAAHDVFLVFRDYLRKIWVSDRESLEGGHLDVLLGLNLSLIHI